MERTQHCTGPIAVGGPVLRRQKECRELVEDAKSNGRGAGPCPFRPAGVRLSCPLVLPALRFAVRRSHTEVGFAIADLNSIHGQGTGAESRTQPTAGLFTFCGSQTDLSRTALPWRRHLPPCDAEKLNVHIKPGARVT